MDFYANVLSNHNGGAEPAHRIVHGENGDRLYSAGAAWDLIAGHDLVLKGAVNIANVSEILKHQAKCDGQGPVFEERAIMRAIEMSTADTSDALL